MLGCLVSCHTARQACTFKIPPVNLTIVRQELSSCVDKIDCLHLQEWLCAHADHDSLSASALAVLQNEKLNVHELLAIALLANEGLILFRPNKAERSTPTTEYELIFKHVKAMRHLPAASAPAALDAENSNKQKTVTACTSSVPARDELACAEVACADVHTDLHTDVHTDAHTSKRAQSQGKGFSGASPSIDLSDLADSLDLPEWLHSIEHDNTCTNNAFADECESAVDNL